MVLSTINSLVFIWFILFPQLSFGFSTQGTNPRGSTDRGDPQRRPPPPSETTKIEPNQGGKRVVYPATAGGERKLPPKQVLPTNTPPLPLKRTPAKKDAPNPIVRKADARASSEISNDEEASEYFDEFYRQFNQLTQRTDVRNVLQPHTNRNSGDQIIASNLKEIRNFVNSSDFRDEQDYDLSTAMAFGRLDTMPAAFYTEFNDSVSDEVIRKVEEVSRLAADRGERLQFDLGEMMTASNPYQEKDAAYARVMKALSEPFPIHKGPICPVCERPASEEEMSDFKMCSICKADELIEPDVSLSLRYAQNEYDKKYAETRAKAGIERMPDHTESTKKQIADGNAKKNDIKKFQQTQARTPVFQPQQDESSYRYDEATEDRVECLEALVRQLRDELEDHKMVSQQRFDRLIKVRAYHKYIVSVAPSLTVKTLMHRTLRNYRTIEGKMH
jgi:hypothetical protein